MKLWGVLLGASLGMAAPGLQAAEQIVFVSGAFRRSIPVADLDHLAQTGQARGLLGDVLRFSRQQPADVARLLNQSVSLPLVLTSRLLATRIGEALLERLARIVAPMNAPRSGVPALRAAVILGLNDGNGTLTPTRFLRAYPAQELAVNIPALLGVIGKANSITELVRFFSESPLDGLRGDTAPNPPAAVPAPPAGPGPAGQTP
jgi:hypothetical protein